MAILESVVESGGLGRIADAVEEGTIATFGAILGEEPTCIGQTSDGFPVDGMVGIISFVGDENWSMLLAFPRDTASRMTLKFAGFEIEYDSPDMGDMVGELANVLAGDVSARLDEIGIRAELSLPAVLRGSDVDLMLPSGSPSVQLQFSSSEGMFWIKVAGSKAGRAMNRRPGS